MPLESKFVFLTPGAFPEASTNPTALRGKGMLRRLSGGISLRRLHVPWATACLLTVILLGCLFAEVLCIRDPTYLDLMKRSVPPGREFWFGTDPMGRDIFAMVWYGGRVSLLVGALAAVVSGTIGVVYGSISGTAPDGLDFILMRLVDAVSSVPSILTIIFVQAALGQATPASIAFVIGATSWMSIAKVVRGEVRKLRQNEYLLASRQLGAGFFWRLTRHLLPNVLPSILFQLVSAVGAAIATESTLSFLGIGLPLETVSWGSVLSKADQALLSGEWWLILIPGLFLAITLVCIHDLGSCLQRKDRRHSNW